VSRTDTDTDVSLRSGLLRDPLAKGGLLTWDAERVFGVEAIAMLYGVRVTRSLDTTAELAEFRGAVDRPSSNRFELALSGRRNRLGAIQSIGTCEPAAESAVEVFVGVFGVIGPRSKRLRTGDETSTVGGPRVGDPDSSCADCAEEKAVSALLRALRTAGEAAFCRTTIFRVAFTEIRGSMYRYGGKSFHVASGGFCANSAPNLLVPVAPIQRRLRTTRFG
jgi:hypothetical protein